MRRIVVGMGGMVKSLRYCWKAMKLSVLFAVLAVMALGFWLHAAERSLNFAKPWIVSALNSPDAPYTVDIGEVTLDWRDVSKLGKMRIKNVTLAKRDGNMFGELPELYATIDPIGFLPNRRLLHRVILRGPQLSMARNDVGKFEFGLENSQSRMALDDLLAFFASDTAVDKQASSNPPTLPFRDFSIENATLNFNDSATDTKIVSSPFNFRMKRHGPSYDAALVAPFKVDEELVNITALLTTGPKGDHELVVQLKQVPSRLFCLFDTCPEGIAAQGLVNGAVRMHIAEDLSVQQFKAGLSTKKATVTLPEWFAEPLKLAESTVIISGDWSKQEITLNEVKLALEDTTVTANGRIHKGEDGWYAAVDAACTKLDIQKLYKYWPLIMAPDSRNWVTSKLKSGYAASGKLKLNLTPADLEAEQVSDKAVDAIADARDITFEYLPGFPLVEKMNGIAHFTGTTVKVEGGGGTLLGGTKIDKAVLWCPELANPKNPMEATLSLTAPASDVVTMLALKHFPFDDHFNLDAKSIRGTAQADMTLKFDAFSGNKNSDPNEIHLEAVDYDITTKLKDIAQENVMGGYNAQAVNGTLKADTKGLHFDGSLKLGESEVNDVTLAQASGKPLSLTVKGRATETNQAINDFALTYDSSSVIPKLSLTGKRLDASISYGSKENSLLANFPAMALDIEIGELVLAREMPFSAVKGSLRCSAARCDSAKFYARTDKGELRGGIAKEGGTRQWSLIGTDAGAALKAFDISDRMTGGRLELKGPYDDSKNPPQLNARLLITDFTLKNSQILGRIFSIGSLTGLANALTGSGISFEKMSADITSRGGLITVSKGVANGAAMGITVDGTVDTRSTKLGLKGVVAPAYALNSVLGQIPIIGELAGGSGGLIAFNYWVNGTYAEPDVGVNPLSGLTPGFLRGIFGAFEPQQAPVDEPEAPGATKEKPVERMQKR